MGVIDFECLKSFKMHFKLKKKLDLILSENIHIYYLFNEGKKMLTLAWNCSVVGSHFDTN